MGRGNQKGVREETSGSAHKVDVLLKDLSLMNLDGCADEENRKIVNITPLRETVIQPRT